MGLFDFVGAKIQETNAAIQGAMLEAEEWPPEIICDRLKKASNNTKRAGYAQALRIKCKEMSERELKYLFEDVSRRGNAMAYNAMAPIMIERGYAHKNDSGRLVRDY